MKKYKNEIATRFNFFYCICFIFFTQHVIGQGEANVWYFGYNAGLDFNSGAPVAISNGQLNQVEGCASMCDAAGNLLFYTDGLKVWNKNHVGMPNGNGLYGGSGSSTQSSLIVPKPGSSTIYYVFTSDYEAHARGISYTEVDMALNAGLGGVTANKNVPLNTPSCEKIAGIRHCNKQDVWVVTHDWNSNAFRAYLVTAGGINPVPVISNTGLLINGNVFNATGYLRASPDGRKLASATSGAINRFELFDFNTTTGVVSHPILFPTYGDAYGVEFSPDGTKLYGGTLTQKNIYQFDLCGSSDSAIANSGVLIGTYPISTLPGALQLGPDNKIYITRMSESWLAIINNPNATGAACNFVYNGIALTSLSFHNLPNFISEYVAPPSPPPTFTTTVHCDTGIFAVPAINSCVNSGGVISSVVWNFGEPSSGVNNTSSIYTPSHIYANAGNYSVSLIINYSCGSDTLQQNITVGGTVTSNYNVSFCSGTTYTLPDGQIVSVGGVYKDTVQTVNGCDSIITTNLTAHPNYSLTQNASFCTGTTYTLPDGQIVSVGGIYKDTVQTVNGCDSIITTNLTAHLNYSFTQNASFCSGTNYMLPDGTSVNSPGTYTSPLVTSNGCDSTITTNLTVLQNASSLQNITVCSNQGYTLSNGTTVYASTIYKDTLVSSNGCDSVLTINLAVNPSPTASISPDITINEGTSTQLTANGSGTLNWSPTTGLSTITGNSVTATPTSTTQYCVEVTAANGCRDTACVIVTIEYLCPVIEQTTLPNAFSPNADGLNDEFCIPGWEKCIKDFKIEIYDRWGQKVFVSNDPDFCWNGKNKGILMDSQVFVYYITFKYINSNKLVTKEGNISLIK